jgi:hypothetical protein
LNAAPEPTKKLTMQDGTNSGNPINPSMAPSDDLQSSSSDPGSTKPGTTIEGILLHGEDPTDEFLEEFAALEAAAPLSDEELAAQALTAPGSDGDPTTPE